MLIAFLFYLGVFSSIATLLLARQRKMWNTIALKRDFVISMVIGLLLFAVPKVVSWNTLLGIETESESVLKGNFSSVNDMHWEVMEKKSKGLIIVDHNRQTAEKTWVLIRKREDGKTNTVFSETIEKTDSGIQAKLYGNVLWVF